MAENLKKKPVKGILKNSKSFDQQDHHKQRRGGSKETKWDEMNIIATLHPADKDYGHMKIDEPKTPYNYDMPDSSRATDIDPNDLAEKLKSDKPPKALRESDEEDDEEDDMTPEEKALKKEFEMKRKAHYNEYYAVKLARKLLEEEDDDDDEEEEKAHAGSSKKSTKK